MAAFYAIFEAGGMLLSSFVIDCTMAIEYLIYIYIYIIRQTKGNQHRHRYFLLPYAVPN